MSTKRMLAAAMAAIMLSGFAVGCKPQEGGGESSAPVAESSEEESVPKGMIVSGGEEGSYPIVDMDGYEYVVVDCTRYGDYEIPPEGTDLRADAFWENKRQVEDDLNCTISYDFYDPVNSFDTIFPKLMSGEKVGDITITNFFSLGAYITSDLVADIQTLPGINLKAKYWNRAVTEACTIGGKTLATSNDMVYYGDRIAGMFYNKTLLNKLGLEDPDAMVKNGTWTYDKFREMALAATKDNGDGVWNDQDQWGLVGPNIEQPLYYAGGNRVFDTTEDGKVVFAMDTPKALESMLFVKDIVWKSRVYYHLPDGVFWMKWHNMFQEGKALFLACTISEAQYFRDMEDEFGYLPMPKGPNADDYYVMIEGNSAIISVFKTNTDLDKTGPITEALAYLGHRIHEATEEDLFEVLLQGYEQPKEMQKFMTQRMLFDVYHTNIVPQLGSSWFDMWNENGDAQACVDSLKESVQTSLDSIFNQ